MELPLSQTNLTHSWDLTERLVLLSRVAAGLTSSGVSVLTVFPCLLRVLVGEALRGDNTR